VDRGLHAAVSPSQDVPRSREGFGRKAAGAGSAAHGRGPRCPRRTLREAQRGVRAAANGRQASRQGLPNRFVLNGRTLVKRGFAS